MNISISYAVTKVQIETCLWKDEFFLSPKFRFEIQDFIKAKTTNGQKVEGLKLQVHVF